MADNTLNSMQAHLGVVGGVEMPMMRTPSPAETSMQLTTQSAQRQQSLQAATQEATFGQQFRQQLQHVQSQQSMNPYTAQMMAQAMPGVLSGASGYMPSPLTMTPASTGVFRPPPPAPSYTPIAPQYTPPIVPGPFTPQLPSSQFMPPWERQAMIADSQADRMASYGMAAPGMAAQAATIGGGAYAGARLGRAFGARGALVGGLVGAAGTALSGLATGARNMATGFMRPMMETQLMGAALQRSSQDWVVQGSQLHDIGRGLTRDASMDLAGQIKDLASDSRFQEQTGGMFNREDLVRITQSAGRAGLMDMEQSVPQIKQRLREVSRTVREFMQLTNDPSVTSVVRQMGQMRQFGISMPEMSEAARNMRNFAKMAGTSIDNLQEIGGLPGAMTFQQAGMSAGSGFMYGNYSAALARQSVASGVFDERRLAMLGGVQGVAQRNMQAQAAMMSMPLYGASVAQYGSGGWELNKGALGQGGGGALGMVSGAANAMSQAAQRGGIGALATFPLEQRFLQDQAAREMSPYEMTAQRFQLALKTGQRLGMSGRGAFGFGARMLYGDQVAEQMLQEGSSAGFWSSQREALTRERQRLAVNQRERTLARGEGDFMHGLKALTRKTGLAAGYDDVAEAVGRPLSSVSNFFEGAGRGIGEMFEDIGDWWGAPNRTEGRMRRYTRRSAAIQSDEERAALAKTTGLLSDFDFGAIRGEAYDPSAETVQYAQAIEDEGVTSGINTALQGTATALSVIPSPLAPAALGHTVAKDYFGYDSMAMMQGGALKMSLTDRQERDLVAGSLRKTTEVAAVTNRAKREGGVAKHRKAASSAVKKMTGGRGGYLELRKMGAKFAKTIKANVNNEYITQKDYDDAIIEQIAATENISRDKARARFDQLSNDEKQGLRAQVRHYASQGDPEVAAQLVKQEERSNRIWAKRIDRAIESRSAAFEENIEAMEEEYGIDGWWGDSDEGAALKEMIDVSDDPERLIKLAANLGGETGLDEAKKFYRKTHGSLEGFVEWVDLSEEEREQLEGLTEDQREALGAFGGKVGGLGDLMEFQKKVKAAPTSAAMTRMFSAQLRKGYGGAKLEKLLTGQGGFSVFDAARTFNEDTLRAMEKAGGQRAETAKLIQRTKEGDEEAANKLMGQAVRRYGKDRVEDEATTEAGGKEGQDLRDAEDKISEVEAQFADVIGDFGPAAQEFKEGAKLFRDAMESDAIARLTED